MNSEDENSPAANPSHTLRDGDTGVGIPRSVGLEGARLVTDDERVQHDRREEDEQRERFRERLLELDAARGYVLPRFIRRTAFWLGLLVASLLGLLIVTQVASLIADIGTMPGPWGWALGATGALCGAMVLWIALKFAWTLLQLQRNPAVNRAAIEALSERELWQRLALEEFESAEEKLRGYLAGYELDSESTTVLMASGLSKAEVDELVAAKKYLLSDDSYLPSRDWVVEFPTAISVRAGSLGLAACEVLCEKSRVGDGARAFGDRRSGRRVLFVPEARSGTHGLLQRSAGVRSDRHHHRPRNHPDLSGRPDPTTDGGRHRGALGRSAWQCGRTGNFFVDLDRLDSRRQARRGSPERMMIWRLGSRTISLLQPVRNSD